MFTFIDSSEDLAYLNKELLLRPYLGVDTEFRRTTKDNMRLALLQVNDDEEIFLIDPLPIQDWSPFINFLEDRSYRKIFHACQEDLELLASPFNSKAEYLQIPL